MLFIVLSSRIQVLNVDNYRPALESDLLLESPILLNEQIIRESLSDKKIIIDVSEKISSTNDYLKPYLNHPQLRVCLAEEQTSGRGRLERSWHSPFGKNIYLSLLYPFQKKASELSGLSLVVSLAVIAACKQITSKSIQVKWPNDVMFQGRKLAGTLIELQSNKIEKCAAIIGMGLNINMLPEEGVAIDQPWVSLKELTGNDIDRNCFVINLLNTLFAYLERFSKKGLADFVDEWKAGDSLFDKKITLTVAPNKIVGTAKGITEEGHLLVELADGTQRTYASGEAQLVKA